MEFGEKLKQARETKGMTQKALAQQLFVTRQAVSRWECGARYPDIITVRKLSQILGVSLDDLLSEEDPREILKKAPVLEDRRSERLQTAVYAIAALPYLMHVVTLLWEARPWAAASDSPGISAAQLILAVCCLAAMGFGVYLSVAGKLNPKMICVMTAAYFIAGFLPGILTGLVNSASLGAYQEPFAAYLSANVMVPSLFCLILIAVPCRYYLARKPVSPLLVSLCAAGLLLSSVVRFAGRLWILFVLDGMGMNKRFSEVLLQFFCDSSFAVLMLLQSRTYHQKKTLTGQEKETV